MTVSPVHPPPMSNFPHKINANMDRAAATPPGATESPRGRRRTRDHSQSDHEGDQNGDANDAEGADETGSSRKRRRSRKGLDKKFVCSQEGCTKTYSRAEHLYRHQLNRKLLLFFFIFRVATARIEGPRCVGWTIVQYIHHHFVLLMR